MHPTSHLRICEKDTSKFTEENMEYICMCVSLSGNSLAIYRVICSSQTWNFLTVRKGLANPHLLTCYIIIPFKLMLPSMLHVSYASLFDCLFFL
jgi:hypothetical protein